MIALANRICAAEEQDGIPGGASRLTQTRRGITTPRRHVRHAIMENDGDIAEDTLFEPGRLRTRATDLDHSDRGVSSGCADHRAAIEPPLFMAATEIMPGSTENSVTSRSHPYTVRENRRAVRS